MLLSFAQFEREVTGERIRDKIAASKKKGMWMGGNVPLGYNASERTLVINPAEAETVRRIFALYLELGCVRRVKDEADRLGLHTKRTIRADGAERGGKPFTRGHIYAVLSNPIYIGQIAHKGELYPGQHPALIDAETWVAVRDQLAAKASDHQRKATASEPSLLAGLMVDAQGERLTPTHAVKKGRRYRYYVSAALITEMISFQGAGTRVRLTPQYRPMRRPLSTFVRLSAGGKRIRTFGPRYIDDACETVLGAWCACEFRPERPTRSQGRPTVRIRFPPA